jgi:hypothetical protein
MPASTSLPPNAASLDVPSSALRRPKSHPPITQQRLRELEAILDRWVSRRRATDEHQRLERMRELLREAGR